MRITVAGTGYVGTSLGILLSQKNSVVFYDIDESKINLIGSGKSPIEDDEIELFLKSKKLDFSATIDKKLAFREADFVVIATPTNYDPDTNRFDTSSIEAVIENVIEYQPTATIVIKSTIPIGYTAKIKKKYELQDIFFSPEFLREGRALYDNLYPSRIVVGAESNKAKEFVKMLTAAASSKDIPVLFTNSNEAEAIKLFANTYLAMRVSYFNELDTFASVNKLDSEQIIRGVSLDPRIGMHYNNPSFGYGGYCLPKDTKQLLANFSETPQNLIEAIVESNETRIEFIASEILSKNLKTLGIYRLIMKSNSENFRSSSIQGVIKILQNHGMELIVYEPRLTGENFEAGMVVSDIELFKKRADIILSNRWSKDLEDVKAKVYTRDLFRID